MLEKLSKLTVGDVADYERWRKEERKRELIELAQEMYKENIPVEILPQIEQQLKQLPGIDNLDDITVKDACYLIWLSGKKSDNDLTLEQVGNTVDLDSLGKYMDKLFPAPAKLAKKKKAKRKPKPKDN